MLTEKDLQKKINETAAGGKGHVLHITGEYTIYDTVFIPSDFTLVMEDCVLTMADGVMAQMFRNAGYIDGGENTPETADKNIKIIGIGRAILDGGNYNGLSERNSLAEGRPHISKNNILLFVNVDGIEIRGLQVKNQRWWALNFIFCRNGVIRDIDFCADDTRIDENGNRVRGLLRSDYESVYVKNADGIDLRTGCSNFLIENITGFCEDDMIALTNLPGRLESIYSVSGIPLGISNVIIRNVRGCSYCSIIRLLSQHPQSALARVLIDGVFDSSDGKTHMDMGIYGVRIGDVRLYGTEQPSDDSMADITVKNVCARSKYALGLAGKMKNVTYENILGFDGCVKPIDDRR